MWFMHAKIHKVDGAARVSSECPNCSNIVDFQLLWNKAGLALGIPVVSLFTDKTMISTHTQYHLGCPTCGYLERLDNHVAKGLIAEGDAA